MVKMLPDLKFYGGEVWSEFVVSCAAMGYPEEVIKNLFAERYGRDDLTVELIKDIIKKRGDDIAALRERQLDSLKELHIVSRIDTQTRKLEDLTNNMTAEQDSRGLVAVAGVLARYLEMLAKISGELKDTKKIEIQHNYDVKASYLVLDKLERDGVIKILDMEKVGQLFEVKSDENRDVSG
jgi:hypothetical protein